MQPPTFRRVATVAALPERIASRQMSHASGAIRPIPAPPPLATTPVRFPGLPLLPPRGRLPVAVVLKPRNENATFAFRQQRRSKHRRINAMLQIAYSKNFGRWRLRSLLILMFLPVLASRWGGAK